MTTLQSGKTATYDAWDRLAKVLSNSTIVQKNQYDGSNRRIQIFSNYTGFNARHRRRQLPIRAASRRTRENPQ